MADRRYVSHPIFLRELVVQDSFPLTPSMQRVVLGGEQLGSFDSNGHAVEPFRTENADDHVKLLIPVPGEEPPRPVQQDGHLDWPPGALERSRDYTPRRFDPVEGRLEIDFVRHAGGSAAEWAVSAKPGDRILVAGPRGTTVPPDDVDWYLLIGDETALPAIARWIEELPAGTPVTAIVSVPSAADEQHVEHHADLDLTWIHRDRTSPDALPAAVRAVAWRPGQVYAWAAGEASMLRPVRRWLRDDKKIDRGHLDISGYWRAGQSQDEAAIARMRLRKRVDLAFPYAVRAAVSLGVAERVADGVRSLDLLAEATGTQPRGLAKLLRLLAHEGLCTVSAQGDVALTADGALLAEEFVHTALDRASGYARLDDGWPQLLHALRTGRSGYERAVGRTFWETLGNDAQLGTSFDDALAERSRGWVDRIVEALPQLDGLVVDVGGGTGTVLDRLLLAAPKARGILVEMPTTAARARDRFITSGTIDRIEIRAQSFFEELPAGGDRYLLAGVLHDWPDAECVSILRRLAVAAGPAPIHLVERLPEAADHTEDLAFDLQLYTVFGGGARSRREYATLADRAGLRLTDAVPLTDELHLLTIRR